MSKTNATQKIQIKINRLLLKLVIMQFYYNIRFTFLLAFQDCQRKARASKRTLPELPLPWLQMPDLTESFTMLVPQNLSISRF